MGCVYLCVCVWLCVCEEGVYVLMAGRGLGEARLSQVCVVFFILQNSKRNCCPTMVKTVFSLRLMSCCDYIINILSNKLRDI